MKGKLGSISVQNRFKYCSASSGDGSYADKEEMSWLQLLVDMDPTGVSAFELG